MSTLGLGKDVRYNMIKRKLEKIRTWFKRRNKGAYQGGSFHDLGRKGQEQKNDYADWKNKKVLDIATGTFIINVK